jgi:hypothetical protein
MDLSILGFAAGSAWLSGINLYATVLILGLLQRFHFAQLPGDLSYLAHMRIIILAGVLYGVQFIADKIPAVDSVWDLVHTFVRVPAGAILAATAVAHLDPSVRLAALLLGGGIALSSHSAKTATRLVANTSPEPISNIALSLLGDVVTLGGAILMAVHPVVILAFVTVAVIVSVFLFRVLWKAMRRGFSSRSAQGSVSVAQR